MDHRGGGAGVGDERSRRPRAQALGRRRWRRSGSWAALLALRTPHPLLAAVALRRLDGRRRSGPGGSAGRGRRAAPMPSSPTDRDYLLGVARDTWRLFERCVVAEDHHLPPDNLQIAPHDMVAHRTSPTNIGLYLLATVCAREFGWIGRRELLERLEATLRRPADAAAPPRPLPQLVRHRRCAAAAAAVRLHRRQRQPVHAPARGGPGLPRARRRGRGDDSALRRELARGSKARIARLAVAADEARLPARRRSPPLLDDADPLPASTADLRRRDGAARRRARRAARLAARDREAAAPTSPRAAPRLGDRGPARDLALGPARPRRPSRRTRAARLAAVVATCQRLAREPTSRFLYNRKRRLFHIGFRVAEHQLDAGFYDLLASEARADQPVGDRQGRRARRPLGRARPAALRRAATWPACARGRARCSST